MLTIQVTAHNAQPLAQPITVRFDESGGTIGRAPGNTLILPDPDRVISRTHALVTYRDGVFVLRDQGSAVAVMVNGRQLGNGRECRLAPGDEIRIAGFAMHVEMNASEPPTVLRIRDPEDTLDPVATAPALSPEMRAAARNTSSSASPVLSWEQDAAQNGDRRITTVILESPGPAPEADAVPVEEAVPAASVPPPVEPSQSPAPEHGRAASKEELLQAFLNGAGVPDLQIPGGLTPALMNELGRLLREATRGVLDLLLARALTKREVHAEMTIIVAEENNPLKFSPNLEAALTHLLTPKGRGFMAPLPAVRDAYGGLRSHQLGFMAGMHAALTAVLARFDPHQVERRLSQKSVADSLLPLHRKAKLWDLYGALYSDIASDARHDFSALFGREFLRAYEAEVARLRVESLHR